MAPLRRPLSALADEIVCPPITPDLRAACPYDRQQACLDAVEALAREILAQSPCLTVRDLALRGQDLMALGLRGPEIGRAQRMLLEGVLEGSVENEKQALVKFLESYPAKKGEISPGKREGTRRKSNAR